MAMVTVAATQMACGWDVNQNIETAEKLVREAAAKGAQIILLQELFERVYFCQVQDAAFMAFATPVAENPAVQHFIGIARDLQVVLPISFYERAGNVLFNSIVVIDADGSVSPVYRKTHIPDGPGYSEKFYFSPGDTGFMVFPTRYGTLGVAICWDQWFPESARAMALMGADLLLYPTAIGSEPHDPGYDSQPHWQLTQQGHSAANLMPLIASNRIGTEQVADSSITFYGSSFITDHQGVVKQQANRTDEAVILAKFDLAELRRLRIDWALFRDRRPELYQPVLTKDGYHRTPFS